MTARAQTADECIPRCAFDRHFTGRINVGDDDRVGIVEAGAEVGEETVETRVAVRLHDGDDVARCRIARGAQYGGDFDRVMRVIVDDGDAARFADFGEAAFHAFELTKRGAQNLVTETQLARDGDGGQ